MFIFSAIFCAINNLALMGINPAATLIAVISAHLGTVEL
jgi:hypothetical protein